MKIQNITWKLAYLFAALCVFLLDQVTKAWAIRELRLSGEREIISGILNFVYAENTGVAFSQLQDGGIAGRYGLSAVALLAAVFVLYYFWKVPRSQDKLLGGLALLLSGILGNFTDRVRLGFVIDWIQFHYNDWYYPVFNIADSAICIGAAFLIWDLFFSKKSEASSRKPVEEKE
jgi:signal peptidase II